MLAVAVAGCGGSGGGRSDQDAARGGAVKRHFARLGADAVFLTGSPVVQSEIVPPVGVQRLRIIGSSEIEATADLELVARVRLRPGPPGAERLTRLVPEEGAIAEVNVPARVRLGLDNENRWGVVDAHAILDESAPVDADAEAAAVDLAGRAVRKLLTLDPTIRDVTYVDVQAPFYATVPAEHGDFAADAALGLMPVPDLAGDQTHTTLGGLDDGPDFQAPELLDDLLLARHGDAPSPGTDCTLALRRLEASAPAVDAVNDETTVSDLVDRVTVEGTIDVTAGVYHCPGAEPTSTNRIVFSVTVGRARFEAAPWRVLRLTLRNPDGEKRGEGVVYDLESEAAPGSPNAGATG